MKKSKGSGQMKRGNGKRGKVVTPKKKSPPKKSKKTMYARNT